MHLSVILMQEHATLGISLKANINFTSEIGSEFKFCDFYFYCHATPHKSQKFNSEPICFKVPIKNVHFSRGSCNEVQS